MSRMPLHGLLALFILPNAVAATAPDLSRAWFKPALQEDHAPICHELLGGVERAFGGTDAYIEALELPGLEEVAPRGFSLDRQDGSSVHFGLYTHPGCGGGCEQYQLVVDDKPLDYHPSLPRERLERAPERSSQLPRLFINSDRQILVVSDNGTPSAPARDLFLHRLDTGLDWTLLCRVATAPGKAPVAERADFSPAIHAVERLATAMGGLSRGYGACGSMRAGERRVSRLPEDLWMALYRPWALTVGDGRVNPRQQFQADTRNLERWALTGVSEFEAVAGYRDAWRQAHAALAGFYATAFEWSSAQAADVARDALNAVASRALAFPSSGYSPFPESEEALRQGILEARPIEDIRALGGSLSDLSLAIAHPQAMRHLLEQGADPNQTNPFGKTPLMYAAQYDQLETARLLLEAGADVNAKTLWPEDDCTYALSTSNMTALHYAARYASPELIELLLQRGAAPFIRTVSNAYQDGRVGTPLDWLRRYTAADAAEPNPHIPAARIGELERALQAPSTEQLRQRARQLTLQAERDYAEGRAAAAYRALLLAREALPQDARILGNLSLIAFKLGEHGPALEAGQQLLDSSQDDALLANAWFNQGLVCDVTGGIAYNDRRYCRSGSIYAYYRAAALDDTPARRERLLAQFQAPDRSHCRISHGGEVIDILVQDDFRPAGEGPWIGQTLYALAPSAIRLRADEVSWQSKGGIVRPRELGTLELGEWRLSVLESRESLDGAPLLVGEDSCLATRR